MTDTAVLDTPVVEPVDVADVARTVAHRVAPRYNGHVTVDDLLQELWLYATTTRQVQREAEAGDSSRVYRSLHGAAIQYCEAEKAHRTGYRLQDVAWYSTEAVERLLPLALDPLFDGTAPFDDDNNEGGKSKQSGDQANLLVQVLDIRAAARAVGTDPAAIVEWLGGEYPAAPGYRGRRAISNAAAQHLTRSQEGE